MKRYLEWDYVADTVIEYKRHGECNKCGGCCRTRVTYEIETPFKSERKAGGHNTDHTGIWQEVYQGRWRHFFKTIKVNMAGPGCGDFGSDGLGDDGLCSHYGERSWICREWPFSPRCVAPFPECGYSFTEVRRRRISEMLKERDETA